eukprot:gb/GECH01013332.1/.p1 GENE.gb/GECH01013332.1/~~gb/GECH01013332.1/.p1  ORF type:complete len:473 (+),score=84.86 gb/GECH01013332.1/:1-1419(+)
MDRDAILCCVCGISMPPNPSNMCINCLRSHVDITEGIPKEASLNYCRFCGKYLQPPNYWIFCELESRELLSICLKKIKGLKKVKLVDANFLWTEPHSKRLKVKLTIQKEVFNGAMLQQSFIVDYEVIHVQCDACKRLETPHKWKAVAQVRQKVPHKRTFYFLEQLILKHDMHAVCRVINIKEQPDGLDFFFAEKSDATKFVEFLNNVVPLRYKTSEKLISHDMKSNIYNLNYTFSVEIAPICREDLVCLPKQLYNGLGGAGPLLICSRVSQNLGFIDPTNLNMAEVNASTFWRFPFRPIASARQLVEFMVLDIELVPGGVNGRYQLAEVEVVRSEEVGIADSVFVRTHLGGLLSPGDIVLGYDLRTTNTNEENIDSYQHLNVSDIVLVRKYRERKRKKRLQLKTLTKEQVIFGKGDEAQREAEYQSFLDEVEGDKEMQQHMGIQDHTSHEGTEPETETDGVTSGVQDMALDQ